jgi:hypothetical protein
MPGMNTTDQRRDEAAALIAAFAIAKVLSVVRDPTVASADDIAEAFARHPATAGAVDAFAWRLRSIRDRDSFADMLRNALTKALVDDIPTGADVGKLDVFVRSLAPTFTTVLAGHHFRAASDRDQSGARQVAASATGLICVAVCLLSSDRNRCAEEFRSELCDLARCGAGRLRQLQYAFRLLLSVRRTNRALRCPHRRGAAP